LPKPQQILLKETPFSSARVLEGTFQKCPAKISLQWSKQQSQMGLLRAASRCFPLKRGKSCPLDTE